MNNKEIFSFLKPFLAKEKKNIFLAIFFAFGSSLIGMTYGYLSGYAINAASEKAFKVAIITLLINLFLSILNYAIFNKQSNVVSTKASLNVMQHISIALFEKVLRLPTHAFEEKSSGEFINRITNDAETITDAIATLLSIALKIVTSLFVFVYVFFNSSIVALEVLIYIFFLYKISSKYRPKIKEYQKEIREQNDRYVSNVDESVHGIREIRALGIHKNILNELQGIIHNLFSKRNRSVSFEQNYYAFIYVLDEIFIAVVFATIIGEIIWGRGTLTFLVAMSYYIYNFMSLVNSFVSFSNYNQKLKVSVERINEIIHNKLYQDVLFGHYHATSSKGKLEFRDVSFHYHDNKQNVLNHFNLTIEPNSKVAIVGRSGEGKSTIFNLILRFFEPNKGQILLDDISIKEYDEISLRNSISIIRQDPFLFNRSILENFTMLDSKITLKTVRKYCKKALIDDYIMSLPNQYDTKIGEGGVNLSGGQKQRLAIARALCKNSKIILLDEATSALDNESQEKIIRVINEIAVDHTVITIAHRLTTIKDADIIYVMHKGNICEFGTHEYLLEHSSVYIDLYKNNA